MQNLKQQGNLGGTRRPKCPKLLFARAKDFMKATTRRDITYEQHDVILKPKHLQL
jgi:hypothetical protein